MDGRACTRASAGPCSHRNSAGHHARLPFWFSLRLSGSLRDQLRDRVRLAYQREVACLCLNGLGAHPSPSIRPRRIIANSPSARPGCQPILCRQIIATRDRSHSTAVAPALTSTCHSRLREPRREQRQISSAQLFVVRRCDGFYRFWHDITEPAPIDQAQAVYSQLTRDGTQNTRPDHTEYYGPLVLLLRRASVRHDLGNRVELPSAGHRTSTWGKARRADPDHAEQRHQPPGAVIFEGPLRPAALAASPAAAMIRRLGLNEMDL
jgi:hypothetical protein